MLLLPPLWSTKQGRRVTRPCILHPRRPRGKIPWFSYPGTLFLPLATRPPCCLLLSLSASSSGLRSPSYKEKPGVSCPPQVTRAPPLTLMCSPSLFPSQWVVSSPLIPPGLLSGCHPTVHFIILLKSKISSLLFPQAQRPAGVSEVQGSRKYNPNMCSEKGESEIFGK